MTQTLPDMAAWQVARLGTPPALVRLPCPAPGSGQALVRVAAAGLNFADLLMQDGRYQDRIPAPFVPGMELAGTLEALGPDTPGPAPGTRVAAVPGSGAFAEMALVPAGSLLTLPDAMPFAVAAGFQIACGTAHLALTQARLAAGETLFVTGAAGGTGLTAVEIGHRMGARVIAQARGPEKAALVRAAGAAEVIDSAEPDLKSALRALGGIDVTYDTVGGAGFDAALRATRPGGRMLAIGFAGGEVPQVPLNHLLVRNVAVMGFWWGGWTTLNPEAQRASLQTLLDWWADGRLSLHVGQELPFDRLPEGLAALKGRTSTGKIVLMMPGTAG